ncbi:hypothetical protein DFH06DRAFT_1200721 [Mycena polygramma]|nr:hypothetical protein DFH06DRAFT_1200721 [Mycena polygramma]
MSDQPDHGDSVRSLNRSRYLKLSYNTTEIPPELWALIACFASRQTLARLCAVSRRFCSAFSALLYTNTIYPPLTGSQSARLVETLSNEKTPLSPHPATLIRDLGLKDGVGTEKFKGKSKSLVKAFKSLELTALSPRGLRVLHWSLAVGVDELGKVLGAPGKFPHLKELMVSSDGTNKNYNFIHIPRLEVLGLDIDFTTLIETYYSRYDHHRFNMLSYKLTDALQMLPSSSPLLNTLRLKLKIPFEDDAFPSSSYADLIAGINDIHLPALATLDLSVDLTSDELLDFGFSGSLVGFLPPTDVSPFLASHPNLADLTLSILGTHLNQDIAFLPRLRSFQGSFKDAVAICSEFFPTFNSLPLPKHLSLTELRVLAVDPLGSPLKMMEEFCPESFTQLVSSFPNLTHLDVCIIKRMSKYRQALVCLTRLKSLRLQQYRLRYVGPPSWPARLLFPPTDYTREIDFLLPCLTQLTDVEICILADTYPACNACGCDSDDSDCYSEPDYDRMDQPPEMTVNYIFSVLRPSDSAYVVLDSARVNDSYSWYSDAN